jgi:hypothetical protein
VNVMGHVHATRRLFRRCSRAGGDIFSRPCRRLACYRRSGRRLIR